MISDWDGFLWLDGRTEGIVLTKNRAYVCKLDSTGTRFVLMADVSEHVNKPQGRDAQMPASRSPWRLNFVW